MKSKFISLILLMLSSFVIANEKPYFTSTPVTIVGEDEVYNYQITVIDPDNDTLILILNNKPDDLFYTDFENDTAVLFGVITTNTVNTVSISVTDKVDTVTQDFEIIVLCNNCCATFFSQPITNAIVDSFYNYDIYAADVDRSVILSVDKLPAWLSFDFNYPNNAILSGTPTLHDTGTFSIQIKAERESVLCPNTIFQIFDLKVMDNLVNIIDNSMPDNYFQIVPNPFHDKVTFTLNSHVMIPSLIEIYNSMGQLILSKVLVDLSDFDQLDLEFLKPDLYYFRILNQNLIQTQKIIKQ